MAATVDVAIVNYNAGSWLRRCVDSIIDGESAARIIVVDNDSTDGSLQSLDDLHQPGRIELIENPTNRGFGAAVNQALTGTSADYLLVLNPDCDLQPDALSQLVVALDDRLQAGIAGPLVCDLDGTEQRACRRRTPTPRRSLITMLGLQRLGLAGVNITGPLPQEATEVDAVSGAAILIKRQCWEQLGGFDVQYFLHCEDLDLFLRAQHAGWKVLFVPKARVTHAKGVSQRSDPVQAEHYKHQSMLRYYRKFFADSTGAPLRWLWPGLIKLHLMTLMPVLWWRRWRAK